MLERKIQAQFPFQVVKYFKGTTLLRRQYHSETVFQIPKVKVAWGIFRLTAFLHGKLPKRASSQNRVHGPVVERMLWDSALDSGVDHEVTLVISKVEQSYLA